MTNSDIIRAARERLATTDTEIEERFVAGQACGIACVQVGRAQAMMRTASQLLDKALAAGVDSGEPRRSAS